MNRALAPSTAAHIPPRAFCHIDTWVFDLDNTLYPCGLDLLRQMDERISRYIAKFLNTTYDEAFRKQEYLHRRYGATVRGMMIEHGMKPGDFLDFGHQIDLSPVAPNPALGAALERLPGRKLIFTNGPRTHADAIVARLAVAHHFEDVFDIVAGELEPKPSPQSYDRFLARHGVDGGRAAMFEDVARNLELPHALGMTTVLVVPVRTREVRGEGWELGERYADHVDYVTDDLVGFLEGITIAG
jgi:putative hydrolase of the HAD superfamily